MKKLVALTVAVCMTVLIFTGCASLEKPKSVTISTATSFGMTDSSATSYNELLSEFRKANTHITIDDRSVKADDHWKSAIRSSFTSHEEPDVMFFFTAADVENIIKDQQVVSIDTIREIYPDYASNIRGDAIASVTEFDGKAYCVPVKGFWEALFCNEELFDKYKIPMVTDWKSLMYAIESFSKFGVTPIAASFSDVPNYWIEHSILSVGGTEKHSINPNEDIDVPKEWEEALNMIKGLYQKNVFQKDSLDTQQELAISLYNSEKAAMILEGSWLSLSPEVEGKTKVVKFPSVNNVSKENDGIIGGFTMGFYISKKAWDDLDKRDACVKYVEYMTSNDGISKLCINGLPAADVELPEGSSDVFKQGDALLKEYQIQKPIDSRLSKSAWEYLTQNTTAVIRGDSSASDVLKKIKEYN